MCHEEVRSLCVTHS